MMYPFSNKGKQTIDKHSQHSNNDWLHNLDNTYKSLLDNHPDLVFTLDLSGNIISFNHIATNSFGYSANELTGSFKKFVAEDYIERAIHYFHQICNGKPDNYDLCLLHKNGKRVEVNITGIPIVVDGIVTGFFGIAKDMSLMKEKEEALKKVQKNLNDAQRIANIGSWDYDFLKDEVFWSDQIYRIFAIEKQRGFIPTFQKVLDIIHPKDRYLYRKIVGQAVEKYEDYSVEYRIIRPNGDERTVFERGTIILDENEYPMRLIGTIQDITERKRIEKKLKENEQQFQTIYNNLEVCIWSLDIKTKKILFISEGISDISGYSKEDVINRIISWKDLILKEDLTNYEKKRSKVLKGQTINHQYRICHKDGSIRWVQEQTLPFKNEEGQIKRLDGIITDITEQKSAEEKITYLAYHDYLTGLPNRVKFEKVLKELIEFSKENSKSFTVIFLDMDRFKHINDSLGHGIGHKLLVQVADRLKEIIPNSRLISRIGGDEFGILLTEHYNQKDLAEIGEKINLGIRKPFIVNDYELYITASIGICQYPFDGEDADTLLQNTDRALYRAKDLGKDNFQIFSLSKSNDSSRSFLLEKDLRKALAEDEFCIHYQPRIDVKTRKMISAEALIRWEHPEWGLIYPGDFIPLAEESGLIIDIGDWVVRNVCQQLKRWQKNALQVVPISVNISPKSFLRSNWSKSISVILQQTAVDPSYLEFEITENILMQNEKVVIDSIKSFKERGIKFALDDFGTGYASITYLKMFQFEYVKIDRSFIQNLEIGSVDAAIAKAIIDLAHGLNMKVVAEGIETTKQLDIIRKFNCDEVQGFLFSKPVDKNQFESFLIKGALPFSS
ncbi:bifunctional diguanylate cyclase/phosphodiesterase [Bacillus sp. FJAT-49736]|uniref:sensor domain-containing protein n=1 Tax=Bacillus sp. FJAT-49736 TaxID=2833582 RepID=UPI001BC9CB5B|nr:bifunctional diguanylate cyclase/phosphodiesterase [Bacillus sp. FJAT-49736]MBS4175570.1 EAL domain-containing protein [Bacillus sp. FJAT-49736]